MCTAFEVFEKLGYHEYKKIQKHDPTPNNRCGIEEERYGDVRYIKWEEILCWDRKEANVIEVSSGCSWETLDPAETKFLISNVNHELEKIRKEKEHLGVQFNNLQEELKEIETWSFNMAAENEELKIELKGKAVEIRDLKLRRKKMAVQLTNIQVEIEEMKMELNERNTILEIKSE